MDDLSFGNVNVSDAAKQRLSRFMEVWGMTFNIMAAFAAPRVFAKLPADHEMTPERVIALFDDYIEILNGDWCGGKFEGDEFHRTVAPTRIVQGLLTEWGISNPLPPLLVQAARDFFTAFGWAEPDGGWDAWEPPPDEPGEHEIA